MKHLTLAAACVALLAAPAWGQWSDDFQSYTVDTLLTGQGGWIGWDGAASAATVAADPAGTVGNLVAKMVVNDDLVRQYSGYTAGTWVYTAKQYIPSAQKGKGVTYFILMNNYNAGGAKGWAAQLKFNMGAAATDTPVVSDVEDGGGTLVVTCDAWMTIRVEINLDANFRATYYNNQLLGVARWYDPANADHVKSVAAVDLWADVAGAGVCYDDLSLAAGTGAGCGSDALENFESYAMGSQLTGQCYWVGWDGAVFPDGVIAADPADSGNKVLKEAANNDIVRQFFGYTSGAWTYKIKQYIPSTNTADTFIILMNKYTTYGSKGWGLTLRMDRNNVAVWDEHGNGEWVVPVLYDQWVEVRVEIDLDANWHTTYYNNAVVGYGPWYDSVSADELKSIAAVDLWAAGGAPVYYDDQSLTPGTPVVVPPPPATDLTTQGSAWSKFFVNVGGTEDDVVEFPERLPTGMFAIASADGNQSSWSRLNDGSPRGVVVTFYGASNLNTDYIGYKFKMPATVTHLRWDNYVFYDGGTFATVPEVQYLDAPNGGTWHTIPSVTWDQSYNSVLNYGVMDPADMNLSWVQRRYSATINDPPANIWGLRLYGMPQPGADDGFPAVGAFGAPGTGFLGATELTLYGSLNLGALNLNNNLALASTSGAVPFARYCQQGAAGVARINDGVLNVSADSAGSMSPTGEDWIGVTWPSTQNNVAAVGMYFNGFKDGGYFDNDYTGGGVTVRIETTTDGGATWTPVTGLDLGSYATDANKLQSSCLAADPFNGRKTPFLFRFNPVSGINGIRIIGNPGGFSTGDGDGFLGWRELQVFATSAGEPQADATTHGFLPTMESLAGKAVDQLKAAKLF